MFPALTQIPKLDYSLTLSENLPYGEQIPRDHHVLKFGLEFVTNTKAPNCRQDPLMLLCIEEKRAFSRTT